MAKLVVGLFVLLFALISVSLYFETSLFFNQVSLEPVRVYCIAQETTNGTYVPDPSRTNYTIESLLMRLSGPFTARRNQMHIYFERYDNPEINFYYDFYPPDYGGGKVSALNTTVVDEYAKNNPPDIVITTDLIKNGTLPYWSIIANLNIGQGYEFVDCKPLLKQTSFDTWEAEYFLDRNFTVDHFGNATYVTADVPKIAWGDRCRTSE